MANFEVDKIRNVAVIAHGGAGKTSLIEAMLFDSGSIDRLGRVDDGTTTTDSEPEEIARKITIISSPAFCNWNGSRINLVDTPGFINFLEDTSGCLRAVDGAVVIVSALSGVKAETQKIWKYASEFELPRMIFINKMDKENANFPRALDEVEKAFGKDALPLQLPIGSGESFSGIIDLLRMKAFTFDSGKAAESEIPSGMMPEAEEYRKKLIEKIAESDDALLERYLEGGALSDEEIMKGVKEGALTKKFLPVTCGSALRNIASLSFLIWYCSAFRHLQGWRGYRPIKGNNPKDGKEIERKPLQTEPLSAYVFKTIADPFAGRLSIFRVYSGSLKADSNVLNATTGAKERIGQVFYLQGKKQVSAQTIGTGEIGVVAKLKETFTGDTLTDEAHPIVFDKVKFADPIISYAIASKNKGDEDKVGTGLHRILEEDPTLRFQRDEETKEMLLSGMGQVHLEVTLERLKRKFGVEVLMKTPKVPYRETIKVAQGTGKVQETVRRTRTIRRLLAGSGAACREAEAMNLQTRSSAASYLSSTGPRLKRVLLRP